jgi:hypothetical protein
VENEFGGDLRAALAEPVRKARKILKSFHGIADPGADRILLFAGISPIAAVPSNCARVLLRILKRAAGDSYSATYREEQRVIATELPETFDARTRAYLLLKRHGQQLCKRTNPKCPECPLRPHCAYAALLQPSAAALGARVSHPRGVRKIVGGNGLPEGSYDRCVREPKPGESLIIRGLKMGGRSTTICRACDGCVHLAKRTGPIDLCRRCL